MHIQRSSPPPLSALALLHPGATMQRRSLSAAARGLRPWLQARGMAVQPAPAEDLIEVTVDGKPTKVAKGSNVLQACDAAGVDIPRCAGRRGP